MLYNFFFIKKTLVHNENVEFINFTIKNVSETDEGNYTCVFKYSENFNLNQTKIDNKSTKLIVGKIFCCYFFNLIDLSIAPKTFCNILYACI